VESLLANLGNPHNQVPVIHVAGSNGKGSVCAYLSSILTEAGYRTGRYTSPHLVDWTERICLHNQPIPAAELYQLLLQVQAAIPTDAESPTQFEVITAAAWLYFAQQQVDVAVIEVGLGGRLDATNICQPPLVSIITSISREHWQILGNTVGEIAGEKAGILKQGCPVVIGALPPDAEQVVRSQALKLQCPLILPQSSHQLEPGWAEYQGMGGKSIKYPLPLPGQIQLTNSAVALAAVEILQTQGWEIPEAAIINGMAKTQWLGRMQWTTWKSRKLLIDGAHNPDCARVLRNYVDSLNVSPVTWVMGILANKDHSDIFQKLLRSHDQLYLVPVPGNKSANPQELAQLATSICPELEECYPYPDLPSALDAAFNSTDGLVVLSGSLYLIGHFLAISSGK
jgi:dihydrofolate synthase/folylpolyglutamate synthase